MEDGTNLVALAHAVATAETGNCKTGSALTHKNAFGIMNWKTGERQLTRYKSCNESFQAFYELWKRKYKIYPTKDLADMWTGKDRADNWIRIVNATYPKYL